MDNEINYFLFPLEKNQKKNKNNKQKKNYLYFLYLYTIIFTQVRKKRRI